MPPNPMYFFIFSSPPPLPRQIFKIVSIEYTISIKIIQFILCTFGQCVNIIRPIRRGYFTLEILLDFAKYEGCVPLPHNQKIPNPSTHNCVKSSHNSISSFENHFDAYLEKPHTKHSYKFFDNLIFSYISPTTIKNP